MGFEYVAVAVQMQNRLKTPIAKIWDPLPATFGELLERVVSYRREIGEVDVARLNREEIWKEIVDIATKVTGPFDIVIRPETRLAEVLSSL